MTGDANAINELSLRQLQWPPVSEGHCGPEIPEIVDGRDGNNPVLRRPVPLAEMVEPKPDAHPLAYDSENENAVQDHDTGFQGASSFSV